MSINVSSQSCVCSFLLTMIITRCTISMGRVLSIGEVRVDKMTYEWGTFTGFDRNPS